MFRNEKPGPGRFRQFMQFDADTVGAASVAADAEICMMAADCLEALGIQRGDYVVKVNNRKVLDGVMEAIGLGGAENAGRRLTVLRAIDKLDRLGPEGVRALLGEGRKDESGDFTKGAGLDGGRRSAPRCSPTRRRGAATNRATTTRRARARRSAGLGGVASRALANSPRSSALVAPPPATARTGCCIDPSVVRGLEYYTGPVFEAELTFEVKDEAGQPGALRLGRRRRALRRAGRALPRRAGAGDRLLHRRVAPARGAAARSTVADRRAARQRRARSSCW